MTVTKSNLLKNRSTSCQGIPFAPSACRLPSLEASRLGRIIVARQFEVQGKGVSAGISAIINRIQGRSAPANSAEGALILVPFEYFEHTADTGLLARGLSLGEAFANAGRGLVGLLVNPAQVRPLEERQVTLAAENLEDLLVDWLNELLFLFDSEGFVPVVYEVAVSGEARLQATLGGEPFDPQRHEARGGVKAATYHQIAVEKTEEGYVLRVILDV